jgi:hypothetical protein
VPQDLLRQRHHPDGLQEVEGVIQQLPFIQPVHPIHYLFATQTPRQPQSSLRATSKHNCSARFCLLSSRVYPIALLPLLDAFLPSRKVPRRSMAWVMLESQASSR